MTIATLVKITAAKKLMMKISEKTYDMISTRLTAECKKKNFPTDRLATFSLENDDGDDCHSTASARTASWKNEAASSCASRLKLDVPCMY